MMAEFWLDTEFNGFGGELISIALVGDEEWYEVLEVDSPTPWVIENVLPVLGKESKPRREVQTSLHRFLSRFSSIHIKADWPEDFAHFFRLLITGAGQCLNIPPATFELCRARGKSAIPHNALEDARACHRNSA